MLDTQNKSGTAAKTDQLDGLRFLAFAAVFFFHFQAPVEYSTLLMFQRQGWIGVEVFFTLSAFLLFRLFDLEQRATGRISIFRFYVRRLLRIYPLMMLFSIAMLVFYGTANSHGYGWLLSLASFVANYVYWNPENGRAIENTAHLWTLSYEFQIYMILPALFLTYLAAGRRWFIIALLSALPLCFAARAAFMLSGMSSQAIYLTPLLRPESSVIGILLALGVSRNIPLWIVTLTFLMMFVGLLTVPDMHTATGAVIVYPVSALFAGSLVHLALYSSTVARKFRWAPLAYLGRISFGLYVFHLWAFTTAMTLTRMTSLHESYATRWIAGMAFCIAVASLSYLLIERPILRMKPRAYGPKMTAGSPSISESKASAVGSSA
ncbi:acyltransferase [Mesorhizobium sp. M00.F.Ca.ET.038.03.1.1]|nr:acyltransferase [Mesorhizobium sp. M00.F.Ca.ET.038.03.1.1]